MGGVENKQYKIIADLTLDEDVNSVKYNFDESENITEIGWYICGEYEGTATLFYKINGGGISIKNYLQEVGKTPLHFFGFIKREGLYYVNEYTQSNNGLIPQNVFRSFLENKQNNPIKSFEINFQKLDTVIKAGTKIRLYVG